MDGLRRDAAVGVIRHGRLKLAYIMHCTLVYVSGVSSDKQYVDVACVAARLVGRQRGHKWKLPMSSSGCVLDVVPSMS